MKENEDKVKNESEYEGIGDNGKIKKIIYFEGLKVDKGTVCCLEEQGTSAL